ncbi:esterase/lipase family protein [Hymenobacter sp. B1770]|uniref:esterase/lipase family protein n=1 Tax=Hymenobacter sp. B1770 TaxID=1718788 RepID=UPI003CF5C5AF
MPTLLNSTAPANPTYAVTLVHGTFAENAEWIQPASDFAQQLAGHLQHEAVISAFNWSGENLHSARLDGGAHLAEHLRRMHHQYPTAEQVVIGHSHGGNVIMYAVKNLGVLPFTLKVVTMATPFLNIQVRELASAMQVLPYIAAVTLGPLLFTLTIALNVLFFFYLGQYIAWFSGGTGMIFTFIGVFYSLPGVTWPLAKKGFLFFKNLGPVLEASAQAKKAILDIGGDTTYASLSVVFQGDEAGMLLHFSQFMGSFFLRLYGRINTAAQFIVNRFASIAMLWLFVLVAAVIASELLNNKADETFTYASIYFMSFLQTVFALLFWLVPFILLSSLLIKSNPLFFGWESLSQIFLLRTDVDARPYHLGANELHVYEAHFSRLAKRNIRHSLVYADAAIIKDIAEWICK